MIFYEFENNDLLDRGVVLETFFDAKFKNAKSLEQISENENFSIKNNHPNFFFPFKKNTKLIKNLRNCTFHISYFNNSIFENVEFYFIFPFSGYYRVEISTCDLLNNVFIRCLYACIQILLEYYSSKSNALKSLDTKSPIYTLMQTKSTNTYIHNPDLLIN